MSALPVRLGKEVSREKEHPAKVSFIKEDELPE